MFLLGFEFVTPGMFFHKSQKERLFSSTSCFWPWKAPEAKKHKALHRIEEKMQSTKHNELSYCLILPQQRKQNTNEFSTILSCHTTLVKHSVFCSTFLHLCLWIIYQKGFISSFLFGSFHKDRALWYLFWSVGLKLEYEYLSIENQSEICLYVLRFFDEKNWINTDFSPKI